MSKEQTKPTTIDVDAMPQETINYLADATWDFIQRLMRDPETRKLLEERVARRKETESK